VTQNSKSCPGEYYLVQIDGSSRYNPGPAGIGVVIFDPLGKVVKEISWFIGNKTNNQAEYQALLIALNEIRQWKKVPVLIETDSELLYYQIIGDYRVRNPELRTLHRRVKLLLSQLPNVKIKLVSRVKNRSADRLAKKATDNRGQISVYEKRNR